MTDQVPVPSPDALAGDLFTDKDFEGGFSTDLVDPGTYNLELDARYNKSNGGIVFVEGKIVDGPYAGKKVKVCSIVLHKSDGQRAIGGQNLNGFGLDTATLNLLAKQTGAVMGAMEPLYQAIATTVNGRTVQAELGHNEWPKDSGTFSNQMVPGKASLVSAPAVAVAGAPLVAVPNPTPLAAVPAPAAETAPPPPAVVPTPDAAPAVAAQPTVEELQAQLAAAQAAAQTAGSPAGVVPPPPAPAATGAIDTSGEASF